MSDKSPKKAGNQSGSDLDTELKQPNKSRRSIAKAGIMAPVMLSLANRPAWGANVRCTVSGFGSLATIGSGVMPSETGGCDYDSVDTLLAAHCGVEGEGGHAEMISDIFSCTPKRDMTLCEALSSDRWRWNKLLVAAWYNEQAGNNPFGSTSVSTSVDDVFCALDNTPGGVYSFGGVMMSKDEIMIFLSTVLNMTSTGAAVIYTSPQSGSTSRRR